MRILCCGNRNRGDDAAALLVADCLRQHGIHAEVYDTDPLGIIESWSRSDDVIVVDAMVTGGPPGSVEVWEVPLPTNSSGARTSTHGLGVSEAIRLAEVLRRLPRRLRVYGIEGKQFDPGAGLSREVKQAAENVAQQIASESIRSAPAPAVP
jgi:hydrogenase maturation protease